VAKLPNGGYVGNRPRASPGCNCPECRRFAPAIEPEDSKAVDRAEALLRRFLTPAQVREWESKQQITVRGSLGSKFRLRPYRHTRHDSVVREDGFGTSVWPIDIYIAADWALAMMLRLENNEADVVRSGCHASGMPF